MNTEKMIKTLTEIKHSIMTSEAVTDTVWMNGSNVSSNETVCEAIDGLLIELGVKPEDLEEYG